MGSFWVTWYVIGGELGHHAIWVVRLVRRNAEHRHAEQGEFCLTVLFIGERAHGAFAVEHVLIHILFDPINLKYNARSIYSREDAIDPIRLCRVYRAG